MKELWLQNNQGGEDMLSAIEKYAASNTNSKIQYEVNGEIFTFVLVTEFMFRAHKEFREAGEIVFVDTKVTWISSTLQ